MSENTIVLSVAMMLVLFGALLLGFAKKWDLVDHFGYQIMGLAFVLLVVLVLATVGSIDSETVESILGPIIGYIFGMRSSEN